MKFRNRKNGIVLDLPENFSGKNWEPVEIPAPVSEEKPKKRKSSTKKTVKK